MQKTRIFAGLVAGLLVATNCVAFAAPAPPAKSAANTITYTTPSSQVLLEGDEARYTPLSVEASELNGVRRIVKVFDVVPDLDPEVLREEDFDMDGYTYTYNNMEKNDTLFERSKHVSQSYVLRGTSNDSRVIIAALPETLPYTDDDGYKGEMKLVPRTIKTEESEHKTITTPHTQSVTKTYTFEYNDSDQIPMTIEEGGNTLSRVSLKWEEESLASESEVAGGYTATAVYSRSWTTSKTVTTGYTTTAEYEGIATVGGVESVQYTVTYVGTKIPLAPFLPAAVELPHVLIISAVVALLLIALIWRHIYVHMAKIYVPNTARGLYETVSRQYVLTKNPRIKLSQMQGHAETEYVVVLHHRLAKKLLGRDVAIETGKEPQHIVVETFAGKDYSFHVTV